MEIITINMMEHIPLRKRFPVNFAQPCPAVSVRAVGVAPVCRLMTVPIIVINISLTLTSVSRDIEALVLLCRLAIALIVLLA